MTLYRKYRSQKLSELVGQTQVTEMLSRAIESDRIAHAYLFAGPRGTGKTSVARILAKAVNCLIHDGKGEVPCNQCANCQAINKGAFLDVVEIDAASHNRVEDARELIEQIHSVPSIGKYKVYILDEVHMLSNAAFNTLLKTLEEPPAHAVFILCTTESHKVPITVASRCQRFVFARANQQQLQQLLSSIANQEKVKIEEDAAALLAQLADGGYRDGVMLLDQTISAFKEQNQKGAITRESIEQQLGLASQQVTRQLVESALSRDAEAAVKQIEEFVAHGGEVRYLVNDVIEQLRALLLFLLNAQSTQMDIDQGQKQWFETLRKQHQPNVVTDLLKRVVESQQQKTLAEHAALSLEMAIIEFASPTSAPQASQPPATVSATAPVAAPKPTMPKTSSSAASPPPSQSSVPEAAEEPEVKQEETPSPPPEPIEPPADLAQAWERVLSEVWQQNRSVGALLKHHCTPLSHDGTILMLQFWNAFHKKQVEVDKNRLLVEKTAAGIFGQPVKLQGQLVDKSLRPKKRPMSEEDLHNVAEPDNDLTDVAAEIFGGEFVD